MAMCKIQFAPERLAEGKRLYELTSTPVPDIAVMMGVSRRTLERRIGEWGWIARSVPRQATDRARVATAPAGAAVNAESGAASIAADLPAARIALAARLQSVVERELNAVERVLAKVGPSNQGEAERSARTLASISRALREIAAFAKPDEVTPPDETDDDPRPLDIDEFRYELARRINAFVDAERGGEGEVDGEAVAGTANEAT